MKSAIPIAPTTPETCPTVAIIAAGSVACEARPIIATKNASAATAKKRPPIIIRQFLVRITLPILRIERPKFVQRRRKQAAGPPYRAKLASTITSVLSSEVNVRL